MSLCHVDHSRHPSSGHFSLGLNWEWDFLGSLCENLVGFPWSGRCQTHETVAPSRLWLLEVSFSLLS